MLEGMLTC